MTLRYDRIKNIAKNRRAQPLGTRLRFLILLLVLWVPLLLGAQIQTHTVKKGDTLYSISRQYQVTVDQIKELNGLTSNNIRENQVLKIKETIPDTQPTPPVVSPEVQPATLPNTILPPPDYRNMNLPASYFYTVQQRDNLYRVAVNHNVTLANLLAWNAFADVSHVIHPGDVLIVKNPESASSAEQEYSTQNAETIQQETAIDPSTVIVEKIYVVQRKDTLYKIATTNGMTVDQLKRLNNLTSNQISVGQRIYLAGNPPPSSTSGNTNPKNEEELQKSDIIRSDLMMPVYGNITSEFGVRNGRPHKGIDISAKSGTPIYAVLDGVVAFSGVQGSYGNVIVLEHPEFVMTVYAHNEANVVKANDRVTKGQIIAYVGSTGDSTGYHLHFEYRLKGKAINPRKVLPLK